VKRERQVVTGRHEEGRRGAKGNRFHRDGITRPQRRITKGTSPRGSGHDKYEVALRGANAQF